MMHFSEPIPSPPLATRLPIVCCWQPRPIWAGSGSSREHTQSGLRCYLTWCAGRGLDPLAARRPDLELRILWMQELRRFKPSTVSRRFSVAAGFHRTCVIDGMLSIDGPADRRARVREPNDFALVAMLGLLGLRIFEATGASIGDLGEEHGHRVLHVCGKGGKVVLVPLPPAVGRAICALSCGSSGPP